MLWDESLCCNNAAAPCVWAALEFMTSLVLRKEPCVAMLTGLLMYYLVIECCVGIHVY